MQPVIAPASPEDAAAIASLKGQVWPAETSVPARIEQVLVQKGHATHIARAGDGTLAGFVDGFITHAANGQRRWEVDLLAVNADYRGQKIGQQLIVASTQAGRDAGAQQARALIQLENFASQGAFRNSGYRTDGQTYRLVISDTTADAITTVSPFLIPVCTMNYNGLWLEGNCNADNLAAAQVERTRQQLDLVGVLIPLQATELLIVARQLGYRTVEHFRWWTLALN